VTGGDRPCQMSRCKSIDIGISNIADGYRIWLGICIDAICIDAYAYRLAAWCQCIRHGYGPLLVQCICYAHDGFAHCMPMMGLHMTCPCHARAKLFGYPSSKGSRPCAARPLKSAAALFGEYPDLFAGQESHNEAILLRMQLMKQTFRMHLIRLLPPVDSIGLISS